VIERPSLPTLKTFVHDHRPHGPLIADATEPEWNGYMLTVSCSCGVTFELWITPADAELDLLRGGIAELKQAARMNAWGRVG